MENKEKILFIIPFLVGGGALKTVANLSKEMVKRFDVKIICIYKSDNKFDFSGELIQLNMIYQKNPIKKLKEFFIVRKFVKNYKKKNNFKFSISFLVIADIINVFSKTKNKEKTIVSIRNNESVEYKNKLFRKMQVLLATHLCDYIVAISKEVENDLIKNFKVDENKIRTIYNPCIVEFKNEKIDENIFDRKNTLITIGGLRQQKGQWHLIRAMTEVVKEIPDIKLLILGKGEYENYLKKIVKIYNLENNITFVGYVLNPHDYVKKSTLFIFPSLYEGLGNALMEMLACEIPVISTDYSCGAREILAPQTDYNKKVKDSIDFAEYGILIPVCDGTEYTTEPLTHEEKIMAKAIIRTVSDNLIIEKYRIQSKIRAKDFEIKNIVDQWYKLFNELEG